MAAPALKPPAAPDSAGETPRLRPRQATARPRPAQRGDDPHPSGARRLQHRLACAFTAPADGRPEALLTTLVILAATCLVLRTAIFGGSGAVGLPH